MLAAYPTRLFAAELLFELEKGLFEADPAWDPVRLSQWASKKHFLHIGRMEKGLEDKITTIMLLGEGPEFEMTIEELRTFAKSLL